jgi:prepilin-type N-terminal cleavage/methylation domain-containing protein
MNRRSKRGFTLVELLLAISIIILVAGVIVPMARTFGGANIVDETLNEVKGYLLMARQHAVQHHRPVAVFFLPPTDFTPNSRMMIFEMKKQPPNASDLANVNNWTVMAGAYGANIRPGLEVVNGSDDNLFAVVYNTRGYIDTRCPPANTVIRIGPRKGTESALRPKAVAISRATGTVLNFEGK